MPNKPTSLDLFSGCGGFTLGMKQAGFETLGAIDFDSHAVAVFKHNFPEVKHAPQADLTQLKPEKFEATTGIKPGEIDVIVGGPPCQGFSQVRQRDGSIRYPHLALYRLKLSVKYDLVWERTP